MPSSVPLRPQAMTGLDRDTHGTHVAAARPLKLIYHGTLWEGSTSLQRLAAFRGLPDVTVVANDTGARMGQGATFFKRIRWKLRWPTDDMNENANIVGVVNRERPDAVLFDNSRVITRTTLRQLRQLGVKTLA